jgi:hypothetical protein
MNHDEPFRRWPYEPRAAIPPGYVGPQWAAPAAHVPLAPRRRSNSGCLALAVGCIAACVLSAAGMTAVGRS